MFQEEDSVSTWVKQLQYVFIDLLVLDVRQGGGVERWDCRQVSWNHCFGGQRAVCGKL